MCHPYKALYGHPIGHQPLQYITEHLTMSISPEHISLTILSHSTHHIILCLPWLRMHNPNFDRVKHMISFPHHVASPVHPAQ